MSNQNNILHFISGPAFGQGGSSSPSTWPTFGKSSGATPKEKGPGASSSQAGGSGHKPPPPERVDSLRADIPPELQGVSVKDLVKALGKSWQMKNITFSPPKTSNGRNSKSTAYEIVLFCVSKAMFRFPWSMPVLHPQHKCWKFWCLPLAF